MRCRTSAASRLHSRYRRCTRRQPRRGCLFPTVRSSGPVRTKHPPDQEFRSSFLLQEAKDHVPTFNLRVDSVANQDLLHTSVQSDDYARAAGDYHEMNKQVVDHDFLTTTDQSEAAHRVRLRMHAAERKEREKRENHDFARGFEAVVNAAGDIMTVLSGEVDSLSRPDKGPSGLEWASSDASSRIKNKLVTAMMHGTTSPPLTLHEPLHGVRTGGAGLRA